MGRRAYKTDALNVSMRQRRATDQVWADRQRLLNREAARRARKDPVRSKEIKEYQRIWQKNNNYESQRRYLARKMQEPAFREAYLDRQRRYRLRIKRQQRMASLNK